ncbi:MAG TPA: hypothetical protein VNH21_13605 [Steroidobacteraceae bacterium]|nr:hypothetical protein [Steroidobacteraceae bacterium]
MLDRIAELNEQTARIKKALDELRAELAALDATKRPARAVRPQSLAREQYERAWQTKRSV